MSHKYLVSHSEASCQLVTRYVGCGGALRLYTSSDGRFQAFASSWYVGKPISYDTPTVRARKGESIMRIELGTQVFPYALELEQLLLQYGKGLDTVVRQSKWRSEFGNFVWALRHHLKSERNPRHFFYTAIDYRDIESFLTQVCVFRNHGNDLPLGFIWGVSDRYLATAMEDWRRGQAQEYRSGK